MNTVHPDQNGNSPVPPIPDMSPEVAQLILLLHWAENLLGPESEAIDIGDQAGG